VGRHPARIYSRWDMRKRAVLLDITLSRRQPEAEVDIN
jgi:hypothetical protein